MNLLIMDNVSKSYGAKQLLKDISFGIDEGEKIGLLGINGSGKSTFLKLLTGREEPDTGQVVRSKGLRMEFLSQNPAFEPEATVMDMVLGGDGPAMQVLRRYRQTVAALEQQNASPDLQQTLLTLNLQMDEMHGWALESDARTMLTRLGVHQFEAKMGELSGGQRKRAALAAALMNPAELLILDEPTNHLDNQAVEWLEKYLQRFSGALVMVTHDRYFLERVTNRIIELDRAHLYSYPGNYSLYLERKLEREEAEMATAERKQSLLRKELAWIRKGARARSTKQKARIERFEKMQEEQVQVSRDKLRISSAASRLGRKTIVLEHVSHGYEEETMIADYSCILDRDERIGIVGPNGIGKSTLLRIMSGDLLPEQGRVEIGSTVRIGYFPQESTDLPEDMRVIDYIREAGEYLPSGQRMLSASQMLETFLFSSASHWTPLQKLSGGEKRRLHLLRILMEAPNVLLLDEPGNDLDIETLTILEDYLDDFPGAVAAVSHDRYFLDRICDKILSFEGQGKLQEYPGNYSDLLRLSGSRPAVRKEQETAGESGQNKEPKKTDPLAEKTKQLKFTFKEQKEYAEIDEKIAAVEKALRAVNERINAAASDYLRLEALSAERQEILKRQDELLDRWMYLNERAEEIEQQKQNKRQPFS